MGRRRKLRGKRLLIATGALAGASMFGCGDDGNEMDAVVANLIPPADTSIDTGSGLDAAGDGAADSAADAVAGDAAGDGAAGDGAADDAAGDGAP